MTSVTAVAASAVMLASIVGLSVNNAHLLALAMLASTADSWASTLPRLLLPLGSSGCAPGTSRPFDLIQYTTNSNKCFLQQRHLY